MFHIYLEMAIEADIQKNNELVAVRDERHDARLSLHKIKMPHLTVIDSSGDKCAFHEKKAREHEGCHLGGGSFGEVFKAVHAVHGDVAVKLAKFGKSYR